MKLFIKKYWFPIGVYLILLAALILRIYNIYDRVGLGSDSTRDALIAQVALERGELPLIGSFSSAGPFVFGPLYFWFNMIALIFMPFSFKTPWILMNIVGVGMVGVMLLCGYFIGGKKLALLTGLLTAFSPQFISRSTGLTQHSLVGITSALLLLFFILYWQKRAVKYAFLMGLSFGTALSMHYQALNFFIFIPFLFFAPKISFKKKIIATILFLLGGLIPSLPLLYWDAGQDFANIRNVLDYILIGQYRIYLPNNWRIFAMFLIDYWSNVVGGNKVISAIIIGLAPLVFVLSFLKQKVSGLVISIFMILGILLIAIRYYRGERFDGYMIYIAPLIFIISAWVLYTLFFLIKEMKNKKIRSYSKYILMLFIFLIVVFDFKNASQFIFNDSDHQDSIRRAEKTLTEKYPGQKFQLYDFRWKSTDFSYPLGGFLKEAGKTDPNGMKIGVVLGELQYSTDAKPIFHGGGWTVISLENFPEKQLQRPQWAPVNPEDIYDDLITRWMKHEKLTSTFFLDNYILEKLHLR